MRKLQLGLSQLEQGKYALAVDYLNNSLRANPDSGDALFARGCAYQHEGQFQSACQDYYSAFRLKPVPTFKACEGYCLNRIGHHADAIAAYCEAIESGYERPALLYNNIGFSYFVLGKINEAEENVRHAIQLDDNLKAAHYNMVMIHLRRITKGQPVSESALVDATKALRIGSHSADFYHEYRRPVCDRGPTGSGQN